ncbi:MAG: DUF6582 domain-containing protein [Nitrososphaerales archaeon]
MVNVEQLRIHGILAPPRVSRNNTLYLPEELKRSDGQTVPFYYRHEDVEIGPDGRPTGNFLKLPPRGQIELHWNPVDQRLEYDGIVEDPWLERQIKSGKIQHVSLAGKPSREDVYRGHYVPIGFQMYSASAVETPGIPETTIAAEAKEQDAKVLFVESFTMEATLDASKRDDLSDSDFAYVGANGDRKLPIYDAAHVRNALARFSQTQGIPESERAGVLAKIHAAAKKFGIDSEDLVIIDPQGDEAPDLLKGAQEQVLKIPLELSLHVKKENEALKTKHTMPQVRKEEPSSETPEQDSSVKKAASLKDASVKAIGDAEPGFEAAEEPMEADKLAQNPAASSVAPIAKPAVPKEPAFASKSSDDADEEDEDMEAAGFTKEEWSTMSRSEKRGAIKAAQRLEQLQRKSRLESSGVTKTASISSQRESREMGKDVQPRARFASSESEFLADIDYHVPNIEEHARVVRGEAIWARTLVPMLKLPKATPDMKSRLAFNAAIESWTDRMAESQRVLAEAAPVISTATTGFASATQQVTPALVVPTNMSALLRDTLIPITIPQGTNTAVFQTITAFQMGALSQNASPSSAAPTLTTVNITTNERGYQLDLSFEAERKGIGPILDASIMAARVGELYDEDNLVVGSGNAFESATLPTSGGLYGTGNQIFGTGVAAESDVTSSMTMTFDMINDAAETIANQGYGGDNLVVVVQPKQYHDLLQDSNIVRYVQWPGSSQSTYIATGVIPTLAGFEIRRSTLGKTATGSPSTVTTRHAWAYKKGLTAALGASRDLQIETFRDIQNNQTVLKVHYSLGVAVIQPNSLVELVSA